MASATGQQVRALAFGLNLSHGYWMPIAAIVAMKASLDQTTIVAAQRLAGALPPRATGSCGRCAASGSACFVMLLVGLLARRIAKTLPRPVTQPA